MKSIFRKTVLRYAAGFLLAGFALNVFITSSYADDLDDMITEALSKIKPTLSDIPADVKKVAVYTIEPDKNKKVDVVSLQDRLTEVLLSSGTLQVIDRKALQALLEEQKLSLTGAVDSGEMVKTGKLIGVQGFFYGSVEVSGQRFILNLHLIDVASSAVIYAKQFSGENFSVTRVGFGWGYASSPVYGAHYRASFCNNWLTVPQDIGELGGDTILNLTLSYKQSFQSIHLLYFGVDINVAHFFNRVPVDTNNVYGLDQNGVLNRCHVKSQLSLTQFVLKPKVYLSCKALFNTEHDLLNPYLGVALSINKFSIVMSADRDEGSLDGSGNFVSAKYYDWEEKELSATPLLAVAPLAGLELNFTNSLSIYGEAACLLGRTKLSDPEQVGVCGIQMEDDGLFVDGWSANAGVKYYLNF